jgi:hypothetical protein
MNLEDITRAILQASNKDTSVQTATVQRKASSVHTSSPLFKADTKTQNNGDDTNTAPPTPTERKTCTTAKLTASKKSHRQDTGLKRLQALMFRTSNKGKKKYRDKVVKNFIRKWEEFQLLGSLRTNSQVPPLTENDVIEDPDESLSVHSNCSLTQGIYTYTLNELSQEDSSSNHSEVEKLSDITNTKPTCSKRSSMK